MNDIQAAEALVGALRTERRAMIAADAQNPAGRNRGAIVAIQAEIEAVEAALTEEKRRRDERNARRTNAGA